MYAVIKTGGKQYKVSSKDKIQVEKLDAQIGDTLHFPAIFFKDSNDSVKMDTSSLSEITVHANVINQIRGEKIKIVKFKRRKHHRKQMGHRQYYTLLEITEMGKLKNHGT